MYARVYKRLPAVVALAHISKPPLEGIWKSEKKKIYLYRFKH